MIFNRNLIQKLDEVDKIRKKAEESEIELSIKDKVPTISSLSSLTSSIADGRSNGQDR